MVADPRFETIDMQLNMGPQHPSTHGVFRMILTVDGERIVDMEPVIGYLHRGVEKLAENAGYRQTLPLFDRLDYLSGFNNELTLVLALEKLTEIEVPERAEYIRVILCELNRIASHLMFYGSLGADVGSFGTTFIYGFRERERIQALFETVSGARLMHNFMRVGGVKDDLPADFRESIAKLVPHLEQGFQDCDRLLSSNEVFLTRMRGVGVISAEEAIDYGLSGPTLRASGVKEDVRITDPYSVYPRLKFEVPVGKNGDCLDRYTLRLEEMRQSLNIIQQALADMPEGPTMGNVPRNLRPKAGEVYAHTECPRGDFGVYLVSQGGDRPYRMKLRTPSFCNLMALRHLLRDCYVADCVIVLGSIDIVLGDVDR